MPTQSEDNACFTIFLVLEHRYGRQNRNYSIKEQQVLVYLIGNFKFSSNLLKFCEPDDAIRFYGRFTNFLKPN